MTNKNKAKTRDELKAEARDYAEGLSHIQSQGATYTFVDGAIWALNQTDQNPSPEVQGLLEALELYADRDEYEGPKLNWEGVNKFGCRQDQVKYARFALETYRKSIGKE